MAQTITVYNPDFIERNGTWLLTMVTAVGACVSGLLVYMLKSRCTHIKCFCIECDRSVPETTSGDVEKNESEAGVHAPANRT